jgi:hypothetical protein
MNKFKKNDKVRIKPAIWFNPVTGTKSNNNPPEGVIKEHFVFKDILSGKAPSSISMFECAIRDDDKCDVGYVVYFPHNNTINPWSEYELETV